MRFLLDTNILSDLIRNPQGPVAQRLAGIGEEKVFTSIIVACELHYGVSKKRSGRLSKRVDALLAVLHIQPFEAPADSLYGMLRADLERAGTLIGPNDLLIAAQTLALGCTLVTEKEREFSRVEGLRLENWRDG